jgi:hypothetical protein
MAAVALVLAPLSATAAIAAEEDVASVVAPAEASLTGSFVVGSDITAQTGVWTPADATLTYVWWQNTAPYQAPVEGVDQNQGAAIIDGATTAQLTLDASLEGRFIWAVVTGSAPDLAAGSVVAAASTPVVLPSIQGLPDVSIVGTAIVGAPLAVALSGPVPDGVQVGYHWTRGGAPIEGAQGSGYTPLATDALASLRVVATFTAEGFTTTTRTSDAIVVAKADFTGAPSAAMAGSVRVGSTVTAVTGSWPEGTTFRFSWRFTDAAGRETVSATTTQAYTPTSNVLARKLSVIITGTVPGHNAVSTRSSLVTIAPGIINAPTPKISGSTAVGSTLQAVLGSWGPADSITYRWKRNGVGISGATARTYKLTDADLGKKITLVVVVKRSGYTTVTRTSAATATVTKPFTKVSTPKISGTARAGSVLTAVPGTWSPTPTLGYQWKRNGIVVSGKTSKTYTLTSADVGAKMTVSITYKRTGYFTRVATSASTATVTAANAMTRQGWFTVGTHVAAGTYYASGGNDCYFERRTNTMLAQGEGLLGYQYNWEWGFGGQKIVTIKATDKYFYTEGCGTWKLLAVAQRSSVGDGTFGIGSQMKTGVWQAVGPFDSDGCYVELLRSFTGNPDVDIIDSGFVEAPGLAIRIDSTMKGFTTDGCGTWKFVSS